MSIIDILEKQVQRANIMFDLSEKQVQCANIKTCISKNGLQTNQTKFTCLCFACLQNTLNNKFICRAKHALAEEAEPGLKKQDLNVG